MGAEFGEGGLAHADRALVDVMGHVVREAVEHAFDVACVEGRVVARHQRAGGFHVLAQDAAPSFIGGPNRSVIRATIWSRACR